MALDFAGSGTGVVSTAPGAAGVADLSTSGLGGFAERAVAREDSLARIPDGISFEVAAPAPRASPAGSG